MKVKKRQWESLKFLNQDGQGVFDRLFAFSALGFFLLTFGSYAYCYLVLLERDRPRILFSNESGRALPQDFINDFKSELKGILPDQELVFKEGFDHWPGENQVQFVFLSVKNLTWEKRMRLNRELHGEASHTKRLVYIYLDRFYNVRGNSADLVSLSLHELGHAAANLDHSDLESNLMFPYLDYNGQFDQVFDEKQLVELQKSMSGVH